MSQACAYSICWRASPQLQTALLAALAANPGLRDLDLSCCALVTDPGESTVSLPRLRSLRVRCLRLFSTCCKRVSRKHLRSHHNLGPGTTERPESRELGGRLSHEAEHSNRVPSRSVYGPSYSM